MGYVAGIDLGTSSVKVLITDLFGRTQGMGQVGYEVQTKKLAYAEQEPQIWWESTCMAIREALDKSGVLAEDIRGIGFSGQMHGLVALDKNENLVCPAMIWMDQRSAEEAKELTRIAGELLTDELLNRPSAGMMLSSLLWLKKYRPKLYEKIDKVMLPKDYIRFKLIGRIGTDYSDACGTLAFSVKNKRWCMEFIEKLEIKTDIWPELTDSCQIVGNIIPSAARETGLSEKTKVVTGGADSAMQLIGNAVVQEGIVACNIGTASQLAAAVKTPIFDEKMRCQTWCHPVPNTWYVQGGSLNGGSTLSWLRNKILKDTRSFTELDQEAALVPPGSEGVIFIPFLAGERTPFLNPQARGVYFGLGMKHEQSHMIRAAMEGVMYNLCECGKIFDEMKIPKERLISSGGAAKGITWKQIQADVLNMPVYTTETEEEACLGAAITAAVGIGAYESITEACNRIVRIKEKPVIPIRENVEKYRERQEIFRELYFSVKDLYPKL